MVDTADTIVSSRALRAQADQLADPMPPLLVEAERVASTVAQGVHGRKRVGAGETFWQYRQFAQTDAYSSVDWRRSARSDQLYVRETEWEAAESVWIWCDRSASMEYAAPTSPCTKKHRAAVLALSCGSLLMRSAERIAPLGAHIPPGNGREALRRLSRHVLAEADTSPASSPTTETNTNNESNDSLPPLEDLPRHAGLVLISDFLSPIDALTKRLERFAKRGLKGHLLQVLDPSEEDLPFSGRTEFHGIEEDTRLMVSRAENLRSAYHQRLAAHRAAIADVCRHYGWSFTTHRTDKPPQLALLALYTAISGDHQPHKGAR